MDTRSVTRGSIEGVFELQEMLLERVPADEGGDTREEQRDEVEGQQPAHPGSHRALQRRGRNRHDERRDEQRVPHVEAIAVAPEETQEAPFEAADHEPPPRTD